MISREAAEREDAAREKACHDDDLRRLTRIAKGLRRSRLRTLIDVAKALEAEQLTGGDL